MVGRSFPKFCGSLRRLIFVLLQLVSLASLCSLLLLLPQPAHAFQSATPPRRDGHQRHRQQQGQWRLVDASTTVPPIPRTLGMTTTRSSSSGNPAPQSTTTTSSLSSSSTQQQQQVKKEDVERAVVELKRVLEREYATFFDPMECEYYADSVSFDDPLTSLQGVQQYKNNVDMLAGRTLVGKVLFADASIQLHSVRGGEVVAVAATDRSTPGGGSSDNDETTPPAVQLFRIGEITTRWTLRFTFQLLPWRPTPRFSGISKYTVGVGGPRGVQILRQQDYWDSINLVPGGGGGSGIGQYDDNYRTVAKPIALKHFLDQIRPGTLLEAPSAGPELPYETLRVIPNQYEVRRYPEYAAVQFAPYGRRDEATAPWVPSPRVSIRWPPPSSRSCRAVVAVTTQKPCDGRSPFGCRVRPAWIQSKPKRRRAVNAPAILPLLLPLKLSQCRNRWSRLPDFPMLL
jgi:Uncharacterized conserved protein (DUF2358)